MRLGFIGTGTIASATVRGLIGGGHQITVSERGAAHAARLAAEFESVSIADNQGVIDQSDTVFIGLMAEAAPDIICCAGFMRILTPGFIAKWQGRMLNVHPSLLPKYKGLQTHQRAIDAGDTQAGCSVHEVTAELDGGPVLGQARVSILPGDTPETLAARVLTQEHRLYPAVLRRFAVGEKEPLLL